MLNDTNLRFLDENNYRYIVGAKLKSLNETGQRNVLEWLNSIEKNQSEITNRIVITPEAKYPIKIFVDPLTESNIKKINKRTYVLWSEDKQWKLALYEDNISNKIIPISAIDGLDMLLSQISENKKKLSRQNQDMIKSLILKYHNKPKILILSYRIGRALKDRTDREKAIQKLQLRLKRSKNPKQLISRYGFQKFIKVEGEAELQIDAQKLQDEARWDGVIGLYINDALLTNEEAIKHYRGLWQVEESFRIQKHDLKIRPVYHWTPQRIKAHISIAFMAFACVRYLEYRVATQSQKLSPKVIKNILINYQGSIIKDSSTNKTYLLPSKTNSELNEIYRVIGQKPPQGLKEIQCSA